MAAVGFKGRINVVGVDLGTTFSVAAVNEHGSVRVIKDKWGNPLVPSIVSLAPDGGVWVGKEARERLALHPSRTVYDAKRFIGREYVGGLYAVGGVKDAGQYGEVGGRKLWACGRTARYSFHAFEWQLYQHFSLLPSSPSHSNAPILRALPPLSFEDSTVREEAGRHPFAVVEHASPFSGVGFQVAPGQVNKAVIAVPAKFTPRQKQATGEAFKRAGLKVMRVLEEPTAAAIAYGLHQKPDVHHILVYDFGGGTLDVSLLYVHEGFVTVEGVDGDDHLGGADFDYCLANHLLATYGDITSSASSSSSSSSSASTFTTSSNNIKGTKEVMAFEDEEDEQPSSPSSSSPLHSCSSYTLLSIAEHLKKRLSTAASSSFSCRSQGGTGSQSDFFVQNISVSRDGFEKACKDVFARALSPVDRCLESNGMGRDEIDEVVMVGGTTRIPKIREMLRAHLNVESLNTHIDPDVTVAVGAACVVD
ncbi:hypothetical protein NSK_005414 [Nannochloropsis salina CCMP1776]|uniref:Uncharacterized protein n=2 Tax=Monodopsidaceae TaxID=425072 RepID=A0A4D9CVJ2_9STRA|nr:hypothetical protein NSK_005414 [Nannochloropsis salina CCMP1776]|eukprot:TFJ83252.1 hypothetical protein NSK_005414 [Nannochloropsis salina CCMP1776]